ncbi:hypothetical protein ACH9D2_09935 [Kocuria sp. M4R2S49]|uniref:hypothetical protein n=1 Tax=Kocuria rhizosphaericola TaxID=3376284 RepID=UPI0037AA3BB9
MNPLLEIVVRHEGLHVVDRADRLCTAEPRPSAFGNVVVHRDLDPGTSTTSSRAPGPR